MFQFEICHDVMSQQETKELNPTMIYYNDQSYMKHSKKTNVPEKPKYIEIKHYTLRDEVQKGEAVLQYISTDDQIAYILVKPLSKMKKFAYSRNKLELVETTSLLKREETTPRLVLIKVGCHCCQPLKKSLQHKGLVNGPKIVWCKYDSLLSCNG